MAEENQTKEVSEEVVTEETQTKESQTIELSEIEGAARQQGWNPDKGELTALEFLSKGREFRDRLYDQIKDLRKDNEKVYGIVADHISKQDKKDHKTNQETIEGQIKEAVEEGDSNKVIELTKKIKPEPEKTEDPNLKEIDQFIADNSWYRDNSEMRADALGFYQSEAAKLGGDNPSIILPKVLARIKKEYPSKFTAENPNQKRVSGAETDGKKKTPKKEGLSRDDLTEDETRHLDDFIKMGMKEDKLLKSIHNARVQRGQ